MVKLAVAVLPSAKATVRVKLDPPANRLFGLSEAKIIKLPPSATAKFTLVSALLYRGPSREFAAPRAQ